MDHIETKFDRMEKRLGTFKKRQNFENKILTKALDIIILKEEFDKLVVRMTYILDQGRKYLTNNLYNKHLYNKPQPLGDFCDFVEK